MPEASTRNSTELVHPSGPGPRLSALHQAHLDAQARQAGYKNWQELELRQKFLQQQRGPVQEGHQLPDGWWDAVTSWHPSVVFQKLSDMLGDVNDRMNGQ